MWLVAGSISRVAVQRSDFRHILSNAAMHYWRASSAKLLSFRRARWRSGRRRDSRACNPVGFITPSMRLPHRRLRGGSRDSGDGSVLERIVQHRCSHVEEGLHRRPVPAIAKLARAVLSQLNRCISGSAQWWPARTAIPWRSSSVATSCACALSKMNEITPPRSCAWPRTRNPGTPANRARACSGQRRLVRRHRGRSRSPARNRSPLSGRCPSRIAGVPASNLCGTSAQVVCS